MKKNGNKWDVESGNLEKESARRGIQKQDLNRSVSRWTYNKSVY
jgi:hypothetical protein